MIFLLVILTFVAGFAISACQEMREKRAQESQTAFELVPSPVRVQAHSELVKPYRTTI